MKDYIEQHKDINTLTIKTPSGGTHYYFKYNDSNENIKFIVKNKKNVILVQALAVIA